MKPISVLLVPVLLLALGALFGANPEAESSWDVLALRPALVTNFQYVTNDRAPLEKWVVRPQGPEAARIAGLLRLSEMNPGDILHLCRLLGHPLDRADREKLWAACRQRHSDESMLSFYSNSIFDGGDAAVNILPDPPLKFYDFDGDGRTDLLLARQGYFGPSLGYGAVALDGSRARILVDIASQLDRVVRSGNRLLLRFTAIIIDPSEAQLEPQVVYDYSARKVDTGPCLAYSAEILSPGLWQAKPAPVIVAGTRVRIAPRIDDRPVPEDVYRPGTRVLFGNCIAETRPGSRLTLLASCPGWNLVAVPPEAVSRTSLRHGMDDAAGRGPLVPYTVLGWIPASACRQP